MITHRQTVMVFQLCLQAFKCDQGSWEGLQALVQGLPGVPDAVISNAALGSATVEQYEPDSHKQDLAMLQVCTSSSPVRIHSIGA